MKKLLYILVALLAFVAGVITFYVRPLVMPVSLHEVSQNWKLYYFNDVHIKAYLESGAVPDYCCSVIGFQGNYMEGAGFDLTEQLEKDENLKRLREELFQKNKALNNKDFDKGEFVAEVIIIGRIEKVMGCFGPPYYIEAREVKQVSPIRFISKEEFQKYKPVIHD
jgi:hypothetical protein